MHEADWLLSAETRCGGLFTANDAETWQDESVFDGHHWERGQLLWEYQYDDMLD